MEKKEVYIDLPICRERMRNVERNLDPVVMCIAGSLTEVRWLFPGDIRSAFENHSAEDHLISSA